MFLSFIFHNTHVPQKLIACKTECSTFVLLQVLNKVRLQDCPTKMSTFTSGPRTHVQYLFTQIIPNIICSMTTIK